MSGASGSSRKEAQYINKRWIFFYGIVGILVNYALYSLSSLSDVLRALAERRNHIPYRNSILTHFLQDTIGIHNIIIIILL